MVERPPILAYADYVLSNWQRTTYEGHDPIRRHDIVQPMSGLDDEAWFILVHVGVELSAGLVVQSLRDAARLAAVGDLAAVEWALVKMQLGLRAMAQTFERMRDGCSPDMYYHHIRPRLFGFDNVTFEGVDAQPGRLRGGSGAQSSIVPAVVAGLGITHGESSLTKHLDVMREYMPAPHRQLIAELRGAGIRDLVLDSANGALTDEYNAALAALLDFRLLHLEFTREYVIAFGTSPFGTGGTPFEDWLRQLIDETERHTV
jgi:indoleamine 2,3-dioxygenase